MSPVMDAILDDIRTYPLPGGLLQVRCGQRCGHAVVLRGGATLGEQIAAGRHQCPRAGEVLDHVLTVRAAQRAGGAVR